MSSYHYHSIWTTLPNNIEFLWRIIRSICCFTNSMHACEDREYLEGLLIQGLSAQVSYIPSVLKSISRMVYVCSLSYFLLTTLLKVIIIIITFCMNIFYEMTQSFYQTLKGTWGSPKSTTNMSNIFILDMKTQNSEWISLGSLLGLFTLRTQRSVMSGLLWFFS